MSLTVVVRLRSDCTTRRPLNDHRAQEEQQQRQHYECVRPPECETYNPHQITLGRGPFQHSPNGARIDCSSGSSKKKTTSLRGVAKRLVQYLDAPAFP